MTRSEKQHYWSQHIHAWQTSGLSQSRYCQSHRLVVASFNYWRQRGKQAPSALAIISVVRGSSEERLITNWRWN